MDLIRYENTQIEKTLSCKVTTSLFYRCADTDTWLMFTHVFTQALPFLSPYVDLGDCTSNFNTIH